MQNQAKHIILGAGGAIGSALTHELIANNENVKLVSRKGHKIDGAASVQADVVNPESVDSVIEESSIVYLMVGLPYNSKIWEEKWPLIIENTIESCKKKSARLLFFDNVYVYGKVDGAMTEGTPMSPSSKKGAIRVRLAERIMEEVKRGNLHAIIARSADFYGPYADKTSIPYLFYFGKLAAGKPAQPLVNASTKHSYTFTGDCGKALYMLAKSDSAFDQIWHLPTAGPPLTSIQFIELVAGKLGVDPDYRVLRKWMIKLAGMFDRQAREVYEMLYQNEFDYIFDSAKFETAFNFAPTPYAKGIEETISFYRLRK